MWNPGIEQITGILKESVLDKNVKELYPIAEEDEDYKNFIRVLNGETVHIKDKKFTRREGYHDSYLVPMFNSDNEVNGVLSIVHDITDLKKYEQELIEKNAFIEKISDTLPVFLYIFNIQENRNVYGNKEVSSILGYSIEEIQTLSVEEITEKLFHPDDKATYLQHFKNLDSLSDGEMRSIEYRLLDNQGNYRWFWERSIIFSKDSEGKPKEIIFTSIDVTERIKAKEKIRRNEMLLSEAQKIAQLGIWEWDILNDKITWSDELFRMFGYEPNTVELSFEKFLSHIHPDDLPMVKATIEESYRQKTAFSFDHKVISKTGEIKILHGRGSIMADQNGNPIKMLGTTLDITLLKSSEIRLKRSEQKLLESEQALLRLNTELENRVFERTRELESKTKLIQTITDNTSSALFMMDEEGRVSFMNPPAEKITGWTFEEMEGRLLHELIHYKHENGTPFPMHECKLHQSFATHNFIKKHEDIFIRKDGTFFPVSCSFAPIVENEKVTGAVLEFRDITEEKKAQKEIEDSMERLRVVLEALPQMAWTTTPDGQAYYFNKKWYDYTRFSEEESLYGKPWKTIVHPVDFKEKIERWEYCLYNQLPFEAEYRIKPSNENENYRWFLVTALPVFDSEDKISMWVGTCTDIHDQKSLTEELEKRVYQRTLELTKANEDLNRSNEELEHFAYVASHDLQEPLRKITLFGERLFSSHNETLDEDGKDYLQRMRNAAMRMQVLIDDLLTFSRISRPAEEFKLLDLNEILNEVLYDLEITIEQKKARINSESLPSIKGIPSQIHQLFQNLISNALKFNKSEPLVTIKCKTVKAGDITLPSFNPKHDSYYEITFQDNGIGFDEKYLEKIFIIFQRLHGRSEYQGTGIGLAICKKILENHSGYITASSKVNQGSTFYVYLPKNHLDNESE